MAAHTALYKRMMHVCMCVSFYIYPHAYTSERFPLYIPHSYNLLQLGVVWYWNHMVGVRGGWTHVTCCDEYEYH